MALGSPDMVIMDDTYSSSSPPLVTNSSSDDLYDEVRDRPRSEHRRPSSHRHQKERRDSTYGGLPSRELAKMLVAEEREAVNLRNTLTMLTTRLRDETQRADDADRRARDVAAQLQVAIKDKYVVEQDAYKVREELRLYRIQFDNAQQEIYRAQRILNDVESQRVDAENAAARARDTARKLKEQRLIDIAREQGRRIGIEEGLARGQDIGYRQGREAGYAQGRLVAEEATMEELEEDDERIYRDEGHSTSSGPSRPPTPGKSPTPPTPRSRTTSNVKLPNFTDPPDRNVPIPPSVATPARIATPRTASPPRVQSPLIINPVQITKLTTYPPLHKQMSFPPDGMIPTLEEGRVRLPPPHDLSPRPTPPGAPPPLPHVQEDDEPMLMMRPPPSDPHVFDRDRRASYSPSHRPSHVRRPSEDSQTSTTISQLDIVSPPNAKPMQARERILSAIVEERSSASPSPNPSPHPGLDSLLEDGPQESYRSVDLLHPSGSSRAPSLHKSSSMSSDEYNISVIPPSRPTSKSYTPESEGIVSTGMLSAEDANHRPLPSLVEEPQAPQAPVISQLPPGFVPYAGGTPTGPPGIPLPPSTMGSVTPVYSFHTSSGHPVEERTEPVIPIPLVSSRSNKAYSTKSGSTRDRRPRPPSSDSDEDISSNLSEDSLTTPPARGTPLPLYAPAPPNGSAVVIPVRPPSAASSGRTAARVPLPSSTSAGTPKSTRSRTTSLRNAYNTNNNNSVRTPASHSRAFVGETPR